jgi:transcription initiation factor IIE alpha subunit
MLPESSIKQLKKLRKEVKGIDINDKVAKDETTLPNVYWMDNPVDGGRIQSYEEFTKKDSQKQTTAFKSKLVNKPLISKELNENLNLATCTNCGTKFNYLSVTESGMGYVKCPECNKPVTQKDINNELNKNLNSSIFTEQDYYILLRVLPNIEPTDYWTQEDIDSLDGKIQHLYNKDFPIMDQGTK